MFVSMSDQVSSARKPLIVRLRNYIGDVVLSIPTLEKLTQCGYELHLLGKPWARDLLAAYGWTAYTYPTSFLERITFMRTLRRVLVSSDSGFERRVNALTFVTAFSSALEMRVAGLRAAGYATESRGWLLHKRRPLPKQQHALDLYWAAGAMVHGDLSPPPKSATLNVHPKQEREVIDRLAHAGVTAPYVVLVPYPGGSIHGVSKKWNEFRSVVKPLQNLGYHLVMAPSASEEEFARAYYPEAIALPRLSLGAYAALLQHAALTIANDTGPGHMAASVGGRLLSILGPTPQEEWGARGERVVIVQGSGTWPTVQVVLDQMHRMLLAQNAVGS